MSEDITSLTKDTVKRLAEGITDPQERISTIKRIESADRETLGLIYNGIRRNRGTKNVQHKKQGIPNSK